MTPILCRERNTRRTELGITDSGILRTERFGSREYEVRGLGVCAKCGVYITTEFGEVCRDRFGNIFCSRECFERYYGFEEGDI